MNSPASQYLTNANQFFSTPVFGGSQSGNLGFTSPQGGGVQSFSQQPQGQPPTSGIRQPMTGPFGTTGGFGAALSLSPKLQNASNMYNAGGQLLGGNFSGAADTLTGGAFSGAGNILNGGSSALMSPSTGSAATTASGVFGGGGAGALGAGGANAIGAGASGALGASGVATAGAEAVAGGGILQALLALL